jgi:Phospholipase_D-nuclease N-terminal
MNDIDAFTWIGLAWFVATALGLTSIWRSAAHSGKSKTIWTVIVLALPFLGAIGWAALGRERRRPR